MKALASYLNGTGIKAAPREEITKDYYRVSLYEPVIELEGQPISKIRLVRADEASTCVSWSILRFQYEIVLSKKISKETKKRIKARTKILKSQKAIGLFGGKVAGVRWVGQDLAEKLNQDSNISELLLKCSRSRGDIELEIEPSSDLKILITAPRFTEPQQMAQMYSLGQIDERIECLFNYTTALLLAEHVKLMVA